MAISRLGPLVAMADSSESRAASSREGRGGRAQGAAQPCASLVAAGHCGTGDARKHAAPPPGDQAVLRLTQLHRPSADARRDLVPILLGARAQLYAPLVAYGQRDPLADGRCHTPPRLACAREAPRGPEQQKSQSRVRAGTSSVIAPVMTLRAIRRGNKRRTAAPPGHH